MSDIKPCAFCGGAPTLERPQPTGSVWDTCARLVCLNIGCCGQGRTGKFTFGYVKKWNLRQSAYRGIQNRSMSVQLALVALAARKET